MSTVTFYHDWTFWSFVAATVAVVLSQIPPVLQLLKRSAVDIEVFNHLLINHKAGIPGAQLHIILRNAGGRSLKVSGLELVFERAGQPSLTLPAVGYFANPTDREAVLQTAFTIPPKGEWAHVVNFYRRLPRPDERTFRQLLSNLRADIVAKRQGLRNERDNVTGDDVNFLPFVQRYEANPPWQPGDYTITVRVHTTPVASGQEAKHRMVIFESDEAELREYTAGYKYGWGILFPVHDQPGVAVELSKL